jgi:hypothetical protein
MPLLDSRAFTLANVLDAYALIEQRKARGKLVVEIGFEQSLRDESPTIMRFLTLSRRANGHDPGACLTHVRLLRPARSDGAHESHRLLAVTTVDHASSRVPPSLVKGQ